MVANKDVSPAAKRRPPAAGIGRKKGVPNKITADLKSMILGALSDAGGQRYLAEQAEKNPQAFMTLVGRVLPMTVSAGEGTEAFAIVIKGA